MSWIRSSKGAALVVLFALALAAVGTAGAISIADETQLSESRVGETVTTTVVIEDPFQDMPDTWTLQANTELRNVSWTLTLLDQGNQLNETVYGTQNVSRDLDLDNGGDELRIELTGDTPPVGNYTYEPRQTYTLWDLDSVSGNSTSNLNESRVHYYTNESRAARQSIDDAAAVINESSSQEARDQLDRAISAFDGEQFSLANNTANDARNTAQQAQQSQQTTQTILYGVVALVVLALIGGSVYYWRSQQNQPTKLQ